MKLAPGAPLTVNLTFDEDQPSMPMARLAMAQGLAQLEWSPEILARKLPVSGLNYPAEPGLHAARRRELDGLHGFEQAAVDAIIDEVATALAAWPAFADEAGVTKASKADIAAAHAAVAQSFFAAS